MKKQTNMLDEMQNSRLLKIEEAGFWLAFWALLAGIVLQLLYKPSLEKVAGEMAVFFVMSAYLTISCLKNGLWTRDYAPTLKTNALCSVFAALAIGVVFAVRALLILRRPLSMSLGTTIFLFMAAVYVVCFVVLEILRAVYQKRRGKLDSENEE